ncbi:MAG TPA: PrgI family protein [Candidatus Saccharimonadales bacterium]|nr:PrgI family protein [Candidatus Saccharimonadales bacterium]
MRTTIVPAQVTTVEDRIAGNLGMSQVLLLVTPIFMGSGMFVLLPPFFGYALYKVVFIAAIGALCGLLSIRMKGKILLSWILVLLHYNLRPRHYVFDKNCAYMREIYTEIHIEADDLAVVERPKATMQKNQLAIEDLVKVEALVADPARNLRITANKKGGLRVHLTETPQESVG